MTDQEVEKIIKSNMMLQMNLAGIRADFEEASQKQWIGLTAEERNHARQSVTYSQLAMTAGEWAEAVQIETEQRLKEKNHG